MIKKFFGRGDVFINVLSTTEIFNTVYQKGDTIASFEDVKISLDYNVRHKEGSATGRKISFVETEPNTLNISGVPNNLELERLLYEDYIEKEITYKEIEILKFPDLIEYFTESLIPVKINAFSNDKQIDFEYFSENNSIKFNEEYDEVKLIKEFSVPGKEYSFDKPNLGYLEIEATVKGKFGEEEGVFALTLPRADLVSEPTTVLTEESNYETVLSFAVVNNERPVMKYVK